MTLRIYNHHDKEKIIHLIQLNTPQYFAEEEEKELIFYLDNFSQQFYLVEKNNEILACGGINTVSENPNKMRLSWDIVHPLWQGKGLGTELTKFRIDSIKNIPNISAIEVRTSQLVESYYQKFGFKTVEIIKDYWAKGFDLYRMEMFV